LQCPSCLARICPNCHVEAHDGISCANRDIGGEKLFREWMEAHDVKSCPGCRAPIEKTEGCNHMTCTRCQTHICWVCLETFPKAEGIYDHMRAAHGGIGL
jgi:LSD1 subclass zinc finger protein